MEKMERRDKVNYYLDLAETVAQRSTCLRRRYGAVIVKNDEVISTGYVGAPRGRANCSDLGYCLRTPLNVPRGARYELCRIQNATCCSMCKRMVINAGIETVVVRDDKDHYRIIPVSSWVEEDESLQGQLGY